MATSSALPLVHAPPARARGRRRRHILPGTVLVALCIGLAACDSPVADLGTPPTPEPPSPQSRLLTQVRVDVDMSSGVASTTVVPIQTQAGEKQATALAAVQLVTTGFVQTASSTCAGCKLGMTGPH